MGFIGFGIATASALLQILEILSRCKQEERKSRNKDFKAAAAWIISSGKMKSGPRALPGFECWRAAVNSLSEKVSEIFTGSGVLVLQRSDTSLEASRDDLCEQPRISRF